MRNVESKKGENNWLVSNTMLVFYTLEVVYIEGLI